MHHRHAAFTMTMFLASCAASEDTKTHVAEPVEAPAPKVAPTETETPAALATQATPSIASVQLVQDCPDPPTEHAKADRATEPMMKAKRKAGSGPLHQPCTQSTMQLAFVSQGAGGAKVAIREVRLMSAEGTALGTLPTRMPSIWNAQGYVAWDGILPANSDTKVSYKLGLPDWSAVESTLGGSSFGPMYVLSVDVDLDGTVTTLTSPQFERGRQEIIKT